MIDEWKNIYVDGWLTLNLRHHDRPVSERLISPYFESLEIFLLSGLTLTVKSFPSLML